jgi:hypothetical protein
MSLSKVKEVYQSKRQQIDAIAESDLLPFTKWFAENKQELYAKTLEANKQGKKPKKLLLQVMKEYLKWKTAGSKTI